MKNGELINIDGSWSNEDNAWVSRTIMLTGDSCLEIKLPEKGRLVIKKSESPDGPFPKALISSWTGPEFRISLIGTAKERYVKICLTDVPDSIQMVGIRGDYYPATGSVTLSVGFAPSLAQFDERVNDVVYTDGLSLNVQNNVTGNYLWVVADSDNLDIKCGMFEVPTEMEQREDGKYVYRSYEAIVAGTYQIDIKTN